jgi:prefoldin subunit 5
MATTKTQSKSKDTTEKATAAKPVEKTGIESARERALQTAETAVDVPVGAALTVYERAAEAIEPLGTQSKREAELERMRGQIRREFNKIERRGGTARRRALQSAKRTRNRVEREVKQQRRSLETTVRENRERAETELKRVERELSNTRADAEQRVRKLVNRAQGTSSTETEVAA